MSSNHKDIADKPTVNNILSCKKLQELSFRWETRRGYCLSPLLFKGVLETLPRTIKKKKEIMDFQSRKEKVKI